ncbi:hypothetical protein HN51_026477 [Arachis hypogaea]|uniref:C2H2-type domain-containing protein n=2 Tax=Arachis hypogaea TaxID=3818 RepID=A0A445CI56_ARAHY|nr:transcriptional regulator SUPERMAN-like [Arachis hypogaea]QHO29101.1 Transcriptional regulator SUPERMAN [Arachis hypogaea]RYR50598.1 hypothetical protein Ahy_A07g037232 isoform A [Arachis hypogaea]
MNNRFNNKNHPIIKDPSSSSSSRSYANGEDYMMMSGFPWPPRSYSCSFCRKEFKSAQALGGHMNVHRRDRARLRHQSPPPLSTNLHHQVPNLNLNLNPIIITTTTTTTSTSNPNLSSYKKPSTTTLPLFLMDGVLLSPLSTKPNNILDQVEGYDGNFARREDEEGCKILKKGEILRVDLEIGLPIPSTTTTTTKKVDYDLDLELRLGTCS